MHLCELLQVGRGGLLRDYRDGVRGGSLGPGLGRLGPGLLVSLRAFDIRNCIAAVSGQHQLTGQVITRAPGSSPLQFLDSISVPQGVQGMFAAAARRGNAGDHQCAAVSKKAVLEDLSQLGAAEGSMSLVLVESPDALLER